MLVIDYIVYIVLTEGQLPTFSIPVFVEVLTSQSMTIRLWDIPDVYLTNSYVFITVTINCEWYVAGIMEYNIMLDISI